MHTPDALLIRSSSSKIASVNDFGVLFVHVTFKKVCWQKKSVWSKKKSVWWKKKVGLKKKKVGLVKKKSRFGPKKKSVWSKKKVGLVKKKSRFEKFSRFGETTKVGLVK